MRFGDHTFLEIKELLSVGALAVIPTGCTEQQGPHLTVDFDTWLAETVCLAAAGHANKKYGTKILVLPAIPLGPTPEHRNYGTGYLDLPHPLHIEILSAILTSLAEQGFQRIALWRGCGQHDLTELQVTFNSTYAKEKKVFLPDWPYPEIWNRVGDPTVPGGHADSFTTSLALFLRPEAVRLEKIYDPKSYEVDWLDPELDFSQYSSSGVIGDPTYATAELGAKLWREVVDSVASSFQKYSVADIKS
jgi:creatinine amidohydrolase